MAGEAIVFDVAADSSKFRAEMAKLPNAAGKATAGVQQAFAGIGGLLTGGAIVAGLKGVIDKFSRVQDLATRFGTSAESIQRVGYAAKQSGTDMEMVARAMTKAGLAAGEAARKGGEAGEKFARAGIDAQAFAGAQLDEKLRMIAAAMEATGGNTEKTNDVLAVLGSKAGDILPLVQNVDELNRLLGETPVLADKTVAALEQAGDNLEKFQNAGTALGGGVVGTWIRFWEEVGSAIGTGGEIAIGSAERAEEAAEKIRRGAQKQEAALDALGGEWKTLADAPTGYEDAALKAHKAGQDAAAKERQELEKLNAEYEAGQRAKQGAAADNEAALRMAELEVKDPAAAAREKAAADAIRMFPGTDEISAQNRNRWIESQTALRGAGGGGGGGGLGAMAGAQTSLEALTEMAQDPFSELGKDARIALARMERGGGLGSMQSRIDGLMGSGNVASAESLRTRMNKRAERLANRAVRRLQESQSRMTDQAAMTEPEISRAAESASGGAAPAGPPDYSGLLDKIIFEIKNRLPVQALGY
jgi:hypothetical protein